MEFELITVGLGLARVGARYALV